MLAAIETLLLGRLARLVRLAVSAAVVVELTHSKVEDCVELVAALRPRTISWSNLPNYYGSRKFHKMARACTAHGNAVHFGYSMNWTAKFFGANLMDYAEQSARERLLDAADRMIDEAHALSGLQLRPRTPTPTNPLNSVSWLLHVQHYRAWATRWAAAANESGVCVLGQSSPTPHNPLNTRGGVTVAMTWTYDPNISFDEG
jgi:hypothetical protein